jgi:hypothetical protein
MQDRHFTAKGRQEAVYCYFPHSWDKAERNLIIIGGAKIRMVRQIVVSYVIDSVKNASDDLLAATGRTKRDVLFSISTWPQASHMVRWYFPNRGSKP